MTLILALAIGVLFGAGACLTLSRDMVRVVAGIALISNAVNLFIMSAGLSRGVAPIHPLPAGVPVSDPLVQALTLTAIVISFGVSALLLMLVYHVYTSHRSIDADDLARAEAREHPGVEREREAVG